MLPELATAGPYGSRESRKTAALTLASCLGPGRATADVIHDLGFTNNQGKHLVRLFGKNTPTTAEQLLCSIAHEASSVQAFIVVQQALSVHRKQVKRSESIRSGKTIVRHCPASPVAISAKRLGVLQRDVRALMWSIGAIESQIPLDEWLLEKAEDEAAFGSKVAVARNAHEQARMEEDAKRLAEIERRNQEKYEAISMRSQLGLDTDVRYPENVRTTDIAYVLGISEAQVRGAIAKGHLPASLIEYQGRYGRIRAYVVPTRHLFGVLTADPAPDWMQQCRKRAAKSSARRTEARRSAHEREESERERREEAAAATAVLVKVRLPIRRGRLVCAEAHLGPTNSGKTHVGLAMLEAAGEGVYTAPLRMMASEATDRLRDTLGNESVGLVTGEEVENPDAPVLCCTAECAPLQAKLMVIDEVHWVADQERGWAWSRLLAGAEVERMVVAGAPESEALLVKALGHDLTVHHHERLGPIKYIGKVSVRNLEPRTVVVAFSRKAVLAIARDISHSGRSTGVLYGAMPPAARRETIACFTSGEYEVLVSTDVIGHGINLPADTVLMAETTKYDGTGRRQLYLWEAAQIIGRAGRFGLSQHCGQAGIYVDARFGPNTGFVANAVKVASGEAQSDLRVQHGELRPALGDLGCDSTKDIALHLQAWQTKARSALSSHEWLRSRPVGLLVERVKMTVRSAPQLSLEDVWQLAMLPVDDIARLRQYALCLQNGAALVLPSVDKVGHYPLDRAEAVASEARDAMVLQRTFGTRITFTTSPASVERATSRRVVELLPATIKTNKFGKCGKCGGRCPPWYSECDSCHSASNAYNDDWCYY